MEMENYYNTEDVFFEPVNLITEANNIQPPAELVGLPINVEMKFDKQKMITAIQYGMILILNYRGTEGKSKDAWRGFRSRQVIPLCFGINHNTGNMLIRGFHLKGWSVAEHKEVEKVWRLFNCANIKSFMITGDFVRMGPKNYKINDRIMTETIIKYADFNEIRRNQYKLIQQKKIQDQEPELGKLGSGISKIEIKNTNTKINFSNPFINKLIEKKNLKDYKFSVLRNISKYSDVIVIMGALGTKNNSVKLFEGKKLIGTYKTIDSFTGDQLKNKTKGFNVGLTAEGKLYYYQQLLNEGVADKAAERLFGIKDTTKEPYVQVQPQVQSEPIETTQNDKEVQKQKPEEVQKVQPISPMRVEFDLYQFVKKL